MIRPRAFTPKLDKKLLAYASAATAAGVSVLATSQPVEAKIVYTSANAVVNRNEMVNVDLNNDGIPDFSLYFYAYGPRKAPPLGYHDDALTIDPLNAANAIWNVTSSKGQSCAAALPAAVKVGPGAAFKPNEMLMWMSIGTAYEVPDTACKWETLRRGAFLGLKFIINGETHYGWAHVTVGSRSAVINGYAYETVPNQPILTGKTSGPVEQAAITPSAQAATLGLLARGSDGMALWRKPEEQNFSTGL